MKIRIGIAFVLVQLFSFVTFAENPHEGGIQEQDLHPVTTASPKEKFEVLRNLNFKPTIGSHFLDDDRLVKALEIALSPSSEIKIELTHCTPETKPGRSQFSKVPESIGPLILYNPRTGKVVRGLQRNIARSKEIWSSPNKFTWFDDVLEISSQSKIYSTDNDRGAFVLAKTRPHTEMYTIVGFVVARQLYGEPPNGHLNKPSQTQNSYEAHVLSLSTILGAVDNPRFFIKGIDTCYEKPPAK